MKSLIPRLLATSAATSAALLLSAGIASAHLTVDAPNATQGSSTVLTFKVSTESDTANTTKLTIELPGFKSARTEPLPGWSAVVDKDADKRATSVTWTADPGGGIGPGQFQRFALSAGPLPEQNELSFMATQTYSDGKVVKWDQPTPADGAEPEFPKPVLSVSKAKTDGHSHGHETTATTTEEDHGDTTARWLGGFGLGIGIGALGLALALGTVIRSRRTS